MILNGKDLSNKILENLREEVSDFKYKFFRKPKLVVMTVGEDPASKVYVRNKEKACEKVGIAFENIKFSDSTEYSIIKDALTDLQRASENIDGRETKLVDGIILQLPIVSNVLTKEKKDSLISSINSDFDVDGFGTKSKLAIYENYENYKDSLSTFLPCTPFGIIKLLESADFQLQGKTALVIGRSDIVGKPIANMLLAKNMSVMVAHSKTPKDVLVKMADLSDLIVAAVGKQDLLSKENIKGKIIIDVGMNRDIQGRLCGDISESAKQEAAFAYTPTPGGTGPMTVAMLMYNVVNSYKNKFKQI